MVIGLKKIFSFKSMVCYHVGIISLIDYFYWSRYFQDLALETLDNLYEMNREDAYAALVSVISFHWGQYVTPLAIADDAEAKRFMGHACCQTFLNLLWMHYMDLDTSWWKLLPVFGLMPFLNIPFITFDKKNLAFGSYKDSVEEVDTGGEVVEDLADTPTVEDLHSKGGCKIR